VAVAVVEAAGVATLAAAECHAAEAEVASRTGSPAVPRQHVADWARAARVGAVVIGTEPAIGTAPVIGAVPTVIGAAATTGMARIGVATTGTATGEIRTVNGVGGMVTSGVIPGTTWCSLAILAFRGGGAGAGALGQAVGAGEDIPTVTTATVILITVAATPITATAMDMALNTSTDSTGVAANRESPSYNGGCHGLVITMDPSTESWARKRAAQSGPTSKQTAT
jgi:hypothetical protein